jgi:hypothetical protein
LPVLTSTIADHDAVRTRRDTGADFLEVFAHCFGVGARHDNRCADVTSLAYGDEQIGGIMVVIVHHWRTRADRCPHLFRAALLSDPCFNLEPDLDGFASRRSRQGLGYQAGEVLWDGAPLYPAVQADGVT